MENEERTDQGMDELFGGAMQDQEPEVDETPKDALPDEGPEEGSTPEGEEGPEDPDETPVEEGEEDEPGEVDELTLLKKQNEQLQQQLNEAYQESAKEAPSLVPSKEFSVDLFDGIDFNELLDDPDKFKQVLLTVANSVKRQTEEALYKNLPQAVGNIAGQQFELRKAADVFYDKNPELASVKPYVSKVTAQVANEHPDWSFEQVLSETAKRARKGLGLEQLAKEDTRRKSKEKRKPAFASKSTGRRAKAGSELSELEQEISELLEG